MAVIAASVLFAVSLASGGPEGTLGRALWIGANPEALAAADVSGAQAAQVLKVLEGVQGDREPGVRRELATLGRERSVLIELLRASPADQAAAQRLVQIDQELAAGESELLGARSELSDLALAPLTTEQRQRLETVKKAASFRVPLAWRTAGTVQDWRAVQLAVNAESRAERHARGWTGAATRVLDPLRSSPAVAQAQVFLSARLQELRALFARVASGS
jgi:hypothetical protein